MWETLKSFVEFYDYAIFTLPEFANGGLNGTEVAGNAGGIRLQVLPGETGFLASSTQEFVQHILYILAHRDEARGIGKAGKEHVRRNFLITRLLRDYLRMFNRLSGNT